MQKRGVVPVWDKIEVGRCEAEAQQKDCPHGSVLIQMPEELE